MVPTTVPTYTTLRYVIDHVFLPPQVHKQEDDFKVDRSNALLSMFLGSLKSYASLPANVSPSWTACVDMIQTMDDLQGSSLALDTKSLLAKFDALADGDTIALHIRAQNAALLIRKHDHETTFEVFELSPTTDAVMGCKSRLRRSFPGPAIRIANTVFADAAFLEPLTEMLVKLDSETPTEVDRSTTTTKANSTVSESRQNTDPMMVTGLLIGALRAAGTPAHNVVRIEKNTRDDVLWKDALNPWRRSPLWLLLRVAIETTLVQTGLQEGTRYFKSFMIFFFSQVLQTALDESRNISSDLLFVMKTKICRRMLKLGQTTPSIPSVDIILHSARERLNSCWEKLQGDKDPHHIWKQWDKFQSHISFEEDTKLALKTFRGYLGSLSTRELTSAAETAFEPARLSRIRQCNQTLPNLDCLISAGPRQKHVLLTDFECWVDTCLPEWLSHNIQDSDTTRKLASLLKCYPETGRQFYEGNPVLLSKMFLTTMELWIAMDRSTITLHSLVANYYPSFPSTLLEPTLLPSKRQLTRLSLIEKYMKSRDAPVDLGNRLHFLSTKDDSLPVRYYEGSPHHMWLRQCIEVEAARKREEKRDEFERLKTEYRNLSNEFANMSCNESTFWSGRRMVTDHVNHNCNKCQLKIRIENMRIDVHEWPLPSDNVQAKLVVFELDVPEAIRQWRDVTYWLQAEVLAKQTSGSEQQLYWLRNYDGLRNYWGPTWGRLQLGSYEKSFTISHYRSKAVSTATEADVLLNHGMRYDLRDSDREQTASSCIGDFTIRAACTLKLPCDPYRQLQNTLCNTTHTSNEIIARQWQCSPAMTLHEFYAFGALRAGHRLQWINIARELTENVLSFGKYEVCALFLQASLQAGPAGIYSILRESHEILEQKHVSLGLLTALEEGLSGVEANWQGAIAARLFTVLASRILSLTAQKDVAEKAELFLRRVRKIVLGWTRELQGKLQRSTDEEERTNLRSHCLEVALIGHLTLGVNNEYVPSLLTDQSDISDAVELMVSVRDNSPTVEKDVEAPLRQLLQESTVLCLRLEDRIRSLVLADNSGLDHVTRQIWTAYRPSAGWMALPAPNQHWLTTKTQSTPTQSSSTVHLNLLTGQLLVKGKPVSRLPSHYESHKTFQRLFGAKILDVIPSSSDGMEFEVREQIESHQVHFKMVHSELVIRTINAQGQVFELVPTCALEGDFPIVFIEDFHHWRNVVTGVVEWRRLSSPWGREQRPWELIPDGQDVYQLKQGITALVEPKSPTGRSLSSLLHPLEHKTYLHAILDANTKEVAVHLPRLNLNFDLGPDMSDLKSRQFRGLVVDRDQAIGTFTGLRSKLVLTTPGGTGCGKERCVIVPFGDVQFARSVDHVEVSVKTDEAARQVGYYAYDLDLNLRKLTGNTTLRGNLYKTYLHAVTAHCLPDKLTATTGTEEALDCIRSASMRSYDNPSKDEHELLKIIADLTPRRNFYPLHLKVMQTVDWSDLPPLSQHNAFATEVDRIRRHYSKLSFLQGDQVDTAVEDLTDGEKFLMERAALRDAVFCLDGFGAETYTTQHDVAYDTSDRGFVREGELRSYAAARLACDWTVDLGSGFNIQSYLEGFGNVTINGVTGPSHPKDAMIEQLGYDQSWLAEGKAFLPDLWCALQHRFSHNTFNLKKGYAPRNADLVEMANHHAKDWANSPESDLAQLPGESSAVFWNRCHELYERALSQSAHTFADTLMPQWRVPFRDNHPLLLVPGNDIAKYIHTADAIGDVRTRFLECAQNNELLDYVNKAQTTLNGLSRMVGVPDSYLVPSPAPRTPPRNRSIRYLDVFQATAPTLINQQKTGIFTPFLEPKVHTKAGVQKQRMEALLTLLRTKPEGRFDQKYAEDLQRSYESLEASEALPELCGSKEDLKAAIQYHLESCNRHVGYIYNRICEAMRTGHTQMAARNIWSDLAPRLSPLSLLQHLAYPKRKTLDEKWKRVLIQYGVALTELQCAQRLVKACKGYVENPVDIVKELTHPGHEGWNPNTRPDWLLLELEGNLLIRPVQARIAMEMIEPSSNLNSILQLNMGEGKSSVIVPIVAAFLADTTQRLARVVVLKPLAPQMLNTLISKCSGLLGRPIYYMPFSRSLRVSVEQAVWIRELYQECMRVGGILLSQPEHLLSFELMGYESILSNQLQVGREMIKTQHWLHRHARDILDESDEILSVIFELIYTMGTQRQIEFSSDRWSLIQSTLGRFSELAVKTLAAFPEGVEVEAKNGLGSFPHIRIVQTAAGEHLLRNLACDICSTGLSTGLLKVRNLPPQTRDQLIKLITDLRVSKQDIESLLKMKDDSKMDESMWSTILVLRGMIACGALSFAFKEKRWRVQYGLDQSRSQLAVPFRAKDMPSARAEYSHPDSTIILTCLSYYYKGLANEELLKAFDALYRCDNAQEEYEAWIHDVGLEDIPLAFRQVKGINLQDVDICNTKLFPRLRFAKGVIDFYLSHLVFPKEMREFPHKLSSSGWDIAQTRAHPTTGFSGTNDSRYILPLSIEQCDLPEQLHTNAMVMYNLLGDENNYQRIQERPGLGTTVNAKLLLSNVVASRPPVRVIIDVGAQVLDLQNEQVARQWLELTRGQQDAQAVVFFNDEDVLFVLDRNETLEPLNVSPFLRQMDRCLVYLDQAHTRGTDLKLPDYRAAVTLGPLLTKDQFVQACMRMRNLGKGQSVVAFASKEIEMQIQSCSGTSTEDRIGMKGVLEWCIRNSCAKAKKELLLWARQGLRYQKQQCALEVSERDSEGNLSLEVAKMLLEPEAQSLEERYGLDSSRSLHSIATDSEKESMTHRIDQVNAIIQKCLEYNITSLAGATLQEEQERELSPENEREQEIERPRPVEPCRHTIHPIIRSFVQSGNLSPSGRTTAYQDAFASLHSTSAGEHTGIEEWPKNELLVSRDFAKTVQIKEHETSDFYVRPVNWIISRTNARGEGTYLIISPTEANELLPSIMDYRQVTLHTYSPRTRLSMRSFEDLSFFALPAFLPAALPSQLIPVPTLVNLFAGQLYFRSWDEYERVRLFLGLCYETEHARSDGFVMPRDRSMVAHALEDCRFAVSPIGFLRALVGIRRKGQSFERSHMGTLLRGEGVSLDELVEA
ncbi:uncharacterized protein BDZ99DRAFT_550822 [Mytilinidion resinicola]|uniref:ubiquitinyl hydrolase 1 n=1 Tax=Mytilinidion resinicola TaxID=574789 RepID=A0A6A6Y1M0_9PEZI|nr:uncharacterized protein BDZ99DRAFT_550822 [Mytilinidion resinicola]KAF2802550.1 hypothetical protein BDZ99DRAFT_550822 [Mytilinidion resinicola]